MAFGDTNSKQNVMKLNNKYFLLRHGQAVSNTINVLSCWPEEFYNPLTTKGIRQIQKTAKKFKKTNIDFIYSSDLLRTKQSSEIIAKQKNKKIIYDKRLREYNFGKFNGTFLREFYYILPDHKNRFYQKISNIETYSQIQKRALSFLWEMEKKYRNKNILIVSHQVPLTLLLGKVQGLNQEQIMKKYFGKNEIQNGQLIEL